MTEYKEGDKVWVPGTIWKSGTEASQVGVGNMIRSVAVETKYIRPRATAPDAAPDVALRAACESLLEWFDTTYGPIRGYKGKFDALRAALAAALVGRPISRAEALRVSRETLERAEAERQPIEGVRVGDFVHDTELYQVCEIDGSNAKITSGRAIRTVCVKSLSFVDRQEPPKTCGRCRWWDEDNRYDSCRQHYPGKINPGRSEPACIHFHEYPPQG